MPMIALLPWLKTHFIFPKLFGSCHLFVLSRPLLFPPDYLPPTGFWLPWELLQQPKYNLFIHPPRRPNVSLIFYRFELLILPRRQTYYPSVQKKTNKKLWVATHISGSRTLSSLNPPHLCCSASSIHSLIYPECSCEMSRSEVGNHIRKSSIRDYELH